MAQWAALRHFRGLDDQKRCDNCGTPIANWKRYCWLCAIFGGQRKLKCPPFKINGHVPQSQGRETAHHD